VERFFDGPTAEGSGYQQPNTALEPETSLNFEGGVKMQRGPLAVQGFVFRNTISDGIRVEATACHRLHAQAAGGKAVRSPHGVVPE
jgi:outer membrane cobalamin receptor